jgi:putative intracellular protease/amidase
MARTILIPLPDRDFDVTEVAVPWKLFTRAGHQVVFATESGATPACDPLLLTGVLFGQLGAEKEPIRFYREMEQAESFRKPIDYSSIAPGTFDALFLPGGHAPGMRQYLGSELLQSRIAAFWALGRPVGAICHGVLVLARARDERSGKSVLGGRRTTCLPAYMERTAYFLTAWKLGRYYRTYDLYVEDEVRSAVGAEGEFVRGPRTLMARGTDEDDRAAFVVEDGNYVSARWPGDAYAIARKMLALLDRATTTATEASASP